MSDHDRLAPQLGMPQHLDRDVEGVHVDVGDHLLLHDAKHERPTALAMLGAVTEAEAKNLEAISKAIDQHNSNCPFPAAEVRMNPFEADRLGWEQIRGLPVVGDPEIGTGRFKIICSRDMDGEGIEEAEALGIPIEVAVPVEGPDGPAPLALAPARGRGAGAGSGAGRRSRARASLPT